MKTVIVAHVRLPAENLPAARAAIAPLVSETLKEPGCISYAFAEDLSEPGLLRISEIWADRASLDAHMQAPHFAEWRVAAGSLGITERQITIFTVSAEETL
ncbi:MAG: putative quinol monooxygenase [Pseudomonadota bacterium]